MSYTPIYWITCHNTFAQWDGPFWQLETGGKNGGGAGGRPHTTAETRTMFGARSTHAAADQYNMR